MWLHFNRQAAHPRFLFLKLLWKPWPVEQTETRRNIEALIKFLKNKQENKQDDQLLDYWSVMGWLWGLTWLFWFWHFDFFMLFLWKDACTLEKVLRKKKKSLGPLQQGKSFGYIDFLSVKHFYDDDDDVFLTTAPVSMRCTDAMIVFKHHNVMCYILGAKYFHSHL